MAGGRRPTVIQGGMGVAVSSWQLARAVSTHGQLGVVSGTALDVVLARRLQDGDPEGDVRRAIAAFPDQSMADRVVERYFLEGGRAPGESYRQTPRLTVQQTVAAQELAVLGNFVEVWLAKEGHQGVVGINYLEKVQMATPAAALGAMVAGVDYVLMGAGVPREIPALLTDLAAGVRARVSVDVVGSDEQVRVEVDPHELFGDVLPPRSRPQFLAIISSAVLATYLSRDEATRPDGFVIEGPLAGGHNAPPRGRLNLDEHGEPIYGPRDAVDLEAVAAVGAPFWLAGAYGSPEKVAQARAAGAEGVQVGTLFALCEESGLSDDLRRQVLKQIGADESAVRTDVLASPTGFPFKVTQIPGTLADADVYEERRRLCDIGYLRTPFVSESGDIGYRCAGEPLPVFVRKGGEVEDTEGRTCLCNALMSNVGLAQTRRDGYVEPSLVTLGSDLDSAKELQSRHPDGWTAVDVLDWLLDA